MNSIEIYEKIILKLDKYDTPEVELVYFNSYMREAMNEYIDTKYKMFETSQKSTDDLREFIESVTIQKVIGADRISLPENYRHLLKLTGTANDLVCGLVKATFEKTTADKLGYSEKNHYWKPSKKKPYFQIAGNSIILHQGNDINYFNSFSLEYIVNPVYYYINPNDMSDISTADYSDMVAEQIANIFVRIFRGDTEQPTYNVSVQESQIKNL